jgi:non-canonical purine NTP pyrophosphatase (RdgB/HAM1 family)
MRELVLATQNPGKIAELQGLLAPAGYTVLGLADVGELPPEPDETGSTFEDNATIKALAYARATGRLCLADDSGLEVDALDGRPGVISSHFAFDGRTDGEAAAMTREQRDRANSERLMAALAGVAPEDRGARFVCTMVLAGPDLGAGGFQPPDRAQPDARPPFHGHFTQRKGDRLPHWDIGNGTYFLTFRAAQGVILSPDERRLILDACRFFHTQRYWLHTACVMPDHVHLLLRTIQRADGSWPTGDEVVHSIKSYTANQINNARGRKGAVWQRDFFDKLMRSGREMEETSRYVQANPVRAGLVELAMDYPFVWRQEGVGLRPIGGLEAPGSKRGEGIGLRPIGGLEAPRSKNGVLAVTRGVFEGRIGMPGEVPCGSGGFGYDPYFLVPPDFARTSAELDKAEKNRLSHRGAAVRAMEEHLRRLAEV